LASQNSAHDLSMLRCAAHALKYWLPDVFQPIYHATII